MDTEAFSSSPIGTLVPIRVHDQRRDEFFDHFAFVPNDLPSSLDDLKLEPATYSAISRADQALGRLDGLGLQMPEPLLVARPTIRKEAVSTSALEGPYTGLADVFEAELANGTSDADVREVRNYVTAAEHGLALLAQRPTSVNMLNELHAILMRGTRGDSYETGRVRQRQNWIGPNERAPVTEAFFVPPPPTELIGKLSAWERWLHREDDIPIVVRLAVAHYQFEALHPYHDGNGRLGRLIVVLHLIERGVLSHHLVSISPYFETRRAEYGAGLRAVSQTGNFNPWIRFFAEGLTIQAMQSVELIRDLMAWKQRTIDKLRDLRIRGTAIRIAEELIARPVISPTAASEMYDVSYPAANNAVYRLVEAGVLEEVTGRSYDRVFAAREVFRLLDT